MEQKSGLRTLIWRFIRPEIEELIGYVAVFAMIAGVAMYQLAVNGQIGTDSTDIAASFNTVFSTTGQYLSQGSGWAKFFLFGFWFIIGGITYTIIWAVTTIIIDIRNDIQISSAFIHPRSFHQSDYWVSIIARTVLRAVSGIALLFYAVFWLWVFAPVGVATVSRFVNDPVAHALSLIFLAIITFVTLHIAVILLRLAMLKPTRNPGE